MDIVEIVSVLQYPERNDTRPTEQTIRRVLMSDKLQQGDRFPKLKLNLIDGGSIELPREIPNRYVALLFYRGKW